MKRVTALTLVMTVLVTLLLPLQGWAAYDKELEKVIITAKSLLNISEGYDKFNYTIHKQDDRVMYELRWNDTRNKLGNINVSIDSTGKIINYYSYKPVDEENNKKLPAVSKEEARKTADSFIKKVAPELSSKLIYMEETEPLNINLRSYNLTYIRSEKGIPFPANGVNIQVDKSTGEIQSYRNTWDNDLKFPDTDGMLNIDEAKKHYIDKLGLQLVYRLSYSGKSPKPYLTYTCVHNNSYIDAKTGEVVTGNSYSAFGFYEAAEEKRAQEMGGGNIAALTPQEQDAVEKAADLIDQQTAEEAARKIFSIDKKFNLNYVSLYNNWQSNDDYVWNMEFSKTESKEGQKQYYGISVALDAKTGEVISFYKSPSYDYSDASAKYTEEQSLQIAEKFIKSLQPERINEVERTAWDIEPIYRNEPQKQYRFTFTRKINGAYFINNGFDVTVDGVTGSVISYNFNWYKKELPPVDNIISLEKAYEVLFKDIGIQVQYIYQYPVVTPKSVYVPAPDQKPDVKLVYALNPKKPANIDAYTGDIVGYDGKPITGNSTYYVDIHGHYAERQIKVLTEYGIFLPGNQLKPDQSISQREFLYLLLKSLDPYNILSLPQTKDEDSKMYDLLNRMGIVKDGEKAPENTVTRQDAVKFVVRALNYDKVAEIKKGIYKLPFKDANKIKPDYIGYMAIAYGLDIIGGYNGYCNPDSNLSRAQGFIMLYNFLNI